MEKYVSVTVICLTTTYLRLLHNDAINIYEGEGHPMQNENLAVTIDVRKFAPGAKHKVIFSVLEAMSQETTMLILNDHDPKPLYYQMSAEFKNPFAWNYLESGPKIWRVEIVKQG